ncbi:glycosyltransferase family 39 protein [Candidatus Curtissbacteria bacterium]|nr:glycosyltransferase family 39 protein [Candidatus Curtissbacteria bacterium]
MTKFFEKSLIILILPLIVLAVETFTLFLKNPPVWPDEAIYANIASNWLTEKRLGPDIWLDAYPGATDHFYSYPPLFFLIIGAYFKLFGASIESQRLISQTAAIVFLIVFFFLVKSIFPNKKVHVLFILPLIALILDPFFSRASRIARPEMTVTLIGSLGFLAFIKSRNSHNPAISHLLTIICGILTSFALLTHFLGGMIFTISILLNFLFQDKFRLIKSKNFYLFILSFLTAPFLYFLSILPNWTIFQYQLLTYSKAVSEYSYFVLSLIYSTNTVHQILIITYIAATVSFIIKTAINKSQELIPFAIILCVSWIAVVYYKEVWYFFYVIPWIYLSASFIFIEFFTKYFKNFIKLQKRNFFHLVAIEAPIILTSLMFMVGLFYTLKLIYTYLPNKYSYHLFEKRILDVIPQNKTVFLSSIPDPYFALKLRGTNTLYEFPVVTIEKEKFLELLDNSDYIIFTNVYSKTSSLLPAYISKNAQKTITIGSKDQYQTHVFELKPKDQRQKP